MEWIRIGFPQLLSPFPAWHPCVRVGAGLSWISGRAVWGGLWVSGRGKTLQMHAADFYNPREHLSANFSVPNAAQGPHCSVQGERDSEPVPLTWQRPDLLSPGHASWSCTSENTFTELWCEALRPGCWGGKKHLFCFQVLQFLLIAKQSCPCSTTSPP